MLTKTTAKQMLLDMETKLRTKLAAEIPPDHPAKLVDIHDALPGVAKRRLRPGPVRAQMQAMRGQGARRCRVRGGSVPGENRHGPEGGRWHGVLNDCVAQSHEGRGKRDSETRRREVGPCLSLP